MISSKKIRVLHVISSFNIYGGIASIFANHCKYIDRERFQFDLVLYGDENTPGLDRFRNLGCNVYILPDEKLSRPWKSWRNIKRFLKENASKYQIIHHRQSGFDAWAWLYYAKKYGIKKRILHAHNVEAVNRLRLFHRLFVSPLNNSLATDFCACGNAAGIAHFGKRPFHWVKNGMDMTRFEKVTNEQIENARKEFGITEKDQVVGCVARFVVEKNYDKSVDYFNLAYRKNPNLKVLFVGDGSEREKIQRKVDELGLTDRVIFTGNRSDVPALMRLMDVFLLPSAFEGFGNVITEALSSNLRCLISSVIPFPQFKDRVFVLNLKESDETWANSILDILQKPKLTDGIAFIRSAGFDIKDSAEDLCDFYVKTLNEEPSRYQ